MWNVLKWKAGEQQLTKKECIVSNWKEKQHSIDSLYNIIEVNDIKTHVSSSITHYVSSSITHYDHCMRCSHGSNGAFRAKLPDEGHPSSGWFWIYGLPSPWMVATWRDSTQPCHLTWKLVYCVGEKWWIYTLPQRIFAKVNVTNGQASNSDRWFLFQTH